MSVITRIIGNGRRGKQHTEAAKKKMSEARKGYKHTEATKKKMSETKRKNGEQLCQ